MRVTLREPEDRILTAAYDLFTRRGVRAVGVDEIITRADVAKATFYRHFKSKDDLILAFLHRRGDLWTRGWLEKETLKRAHDPKTRMLAIFDVMDSWFQRDDFEGCPFIGILGQVQPRDRVRKEAVNQMGAVRAFVRKLAQDAGAKDADALAASWQTLMAGSIVMALSGTSGAARLAKAVGEVLLAQGNGA
jgi:AcrR family transcriptional regulator